MLEFLGLPMPPGFTEAQFEEAIISNLQRFLLELGKGFSFVGRQYRITTDSYSPQKTNCAGNWSANGPGCWTRWMQ